VFILDLDGFKQVNDQFGHDVGDQLLIAVADRLRSNLRSTDLLSRMGGDEFLVMSSGFKLASQAHDLGEQLVKSIAAPFTVSQHHCQIGLTVGYAIAPADANDTRLLLKRADAAMYAGKQSGKNCVRHAAPADNLI
jgi:diguanylate cyclase